jgi:hypothetical protein
MFIIFRKSLFLSNLLHKVVGVSSRMEVPMDDQRGLGRQWSAHRRAEARARSSPGRNCFSSALVLRRRRVGGRRLCGGRRISLPLSQICLGFGPHRRFSPVCGGVAASSVSSGSGGGHGLRGSRSGACSSRSVWLQAVM